ncbi:Sel1 repeat protein [Neisseria sicca ATCC 29256]|uniref:Sel1 repeat protein n=1 Tax=Neisseria sicca ATCC 29256 TaxID=547045 RepID=C6M3P0_NEISI|nr:Sel1 repeat protein [Neisseria sicca ATCC 29256]
MNTLLKNMMLALLSLGIVQAVWADDVPDLQKTLQSAKQGNADAQFNLGLMYDSGRGVRQDYTKAVQWYRKAAEQGVAEAQFNWVWRMQKGKAFVKTMHKQCSGIGRWQNKDILKLN